MSESTTCPSDLFMRQINLLCIIDDEDKEIWYSSVYGILSIIFAFMGVLLLVQSRKVKKQLIEHDQKVPNDTYCVLTLNVMQYTQVMLILSIGLCLFTGIGFALGKDWGQWLYTQDYKECADSQPMMMNGIILNIFYFVLNIKLSVAFCVLILQVQEWFSSVYLI